MPSKAMLEMLAAMDGAGDDDYEAEVVRERRQCWRGAARVANRILEEAVRCSALDSVGDEGGIERYVINGIGRAVLRRPELAEEIMAAALAGRQFTVRDDRVADLQDPSPPAP
jgi:hypothetical protein